MTISKEELQKEVNTYVNKIEYDFKSTQTVGDKVADSIASSGGSWRFIFAFATFLTVWVLWNSLSITKAYHFDDQPFILLNLMLSFTAAFQAPFIMMSQKRQSQRDRYVADLDFKRGYMSERNGEEMHDHLDELVESTREIKIVYDEIREVYPMIKDIHQYIMENGWNNK